MVFWYAYTRQRRQLVYLQTCLRLTDDRCTCTFISTAVLFTLRKIVVLNHTSQSAIRLSFLEKAQFPRRAISIYFLF